MTSNNTTIFKQELEILKRQVNEEIITTKTLTSITSDCGTLQIPFVGPKSRRFNQSRQRAQKGTILSPRD